MCQNKCQEWLPFDPDNIPEAKSGWGLIINKPIWCNGAMYFSFEHNKWKWDGYEKYIEYIQFTEGCQYKLVPLT